MYVGYSYKYKFEKCPYFKDNDNRIISYSSLYKTSNNYISNKEPSFYFILNNFELLITRNYLNSHQKDQLL